MKCMACKFENDFEDDFLEINGMFIMSREASYGPDIKEEMNFYACPKCGTLRTDHYLIENIQDN